MASRWALSRGSSDRREPGLGWRDQLRVLRRVLPLMWPEGEPGLKLRVISAFALIVAAKLVNVTLPLVYKSVIDSLTTRPNAVLVVPIALIIGYGLVRVASSATTEIRDMIFAKVQERALRLISVSVLKHLHDLSLRFHLERQTGGLSRAIERGTESIESLLTYLLFSIAPIILELVLVTAVLWHYLSFALAAATFSVVAGYAVYTAAATQWRMKYRREMNAQDREANARAIDSLLNYETVKYFANEQHELERFDEAKRDYVTAAIANQRSLSIFNIGQSSILSVGIVIVMLMAAYGVAAGRMTIGEFVMVNAYLLQLYQPLNMLSWVWRILRQAFTDIEQMYGLLEETSEVEDRPGASALDVAAGRIIFEHVDFAYDVRRPILSDVGFEIPAGRTVAIVGPTGGGKSTIARLLFRFYDPQGGAIRIDGQDLRDVTQASLRRAIGVVPQDTVLFNDSIYYNIAYGRPDAPPQDVMESARRAQLTDFIAKLPDGYETRVGERGLKLSGGEKQRVAIARVILKNPQILIFDEATSSLDSHTEHEIQASLREVSAHRTTMIIAHRLSTVVDADEILVLDDGGIVERGTHEGLLARGGAYAAMWDRQQRAAAERLAEVAE
ncbi:MAG TPA: ABC transporter ATP-binding protein/permease [Micropepsaceae bacterium]|nr:ABC transporter ATP-binding protein/permease [Micropepsaceae bacterium]